MTWNTIRAGELGRSALKLIGSILFLGALAAVLAKRWVAALELAMLAAACTIALLWARRSQAEAGRRAPIAPPDGQ